MNWILWALLSALFAGLTAVLAKVGVSGVNSNLATAIRTTVVLVFTWAIAFGSVSPSRIGVNRTANMAFSSLIRACNRTFMAVLLSGFTDGQRLACRAYRQTQRRVRHGFRRYILARTVNVASLDGRRAYGCRRSLAGMALTIGIQ